MVRWITRTNYSAEANRTTSFDLSSQTTRDSFQPSIQRALDRCGSIRAERYLDELRQSINIADDEVRQQTLRRHS
jgi:hypothetical protein